MILSLDITLIIKQWVSEKMIELELGTTRCVFCERVKKFVDIGVMGGTPHVQFCMPRVKCKYYVEGERYNSVANRVSQVGDYYEVSGCEIRKC